MTNSVGEPPIFNNYVYPYSNYFPLPPVQGPSPYLCPVCQGKGTVPANFYNHNEFDTCASPEICRTCGGEGIIWRY